MIEVIIMCSVIISVLLVLYHHLGYPLILKWAQRHQQNDDILFKPRHYTDKYSDKQLPTISLVIPAFNEQQWVADKIRNCAALDYPQDKLRVIIACDGCTDNTLEIAQNTAQENNCLALDLEICEFKNNRGKVAVLNDVIASLDSDLVALSDVSALISLDALVVAAAQFKLKQLGVINSHYCLMAPSSVGEASYWQYQSKIKLAESSLGSTLGAHGAFYIFRRELFKTLAKDTINDDFILPMQIVASGYVAKQDNRIVSVECERTDSTMDWQRRVRIASGNMQQVLRLKSMFHPQYGGIAFAFASGKALRVAMPFLMVTALLGSLFLAPEYLSFALLAMAQLALYFFAFIYALFKPNNKYLKVLSYLVNGHIAGMMGALSYLCKGHQQPWKPVYSAEQPKEKRHEHSI
jgi:cellulose synthase/poly-beta-1,6-N-acetylglucosamine synthase-like glycosyltransferase